MSVTLAKYAGFCSGVRRSVETAKRLVEEAARDPNAPPIYMYGELIHNRLVIDEFAEQGVRVLNRVEDAEPGSTIIVRAHGITPQEKKTLEATGSTVVDCTCGYVQHIHNLVREAWLAGKNIIIIGNPNHPEIIGINGECNHQAVIIQTPEEVQNMDFEDGEWILVAQTTFSLDVFSDIVQNLHNKIEKIHIFDTICSATESRQKEAGFLASQSDVMIVIGSQHSSNTVKLLDTCRSRCGETYLVESMSDLKNLLAENDFSDRRIGITAGASSPKSIIMEVFHIMDENKTLDEQQVETTEQDLTTVDASTPQDDTLSTAEVFDVDDESAEEDKTAAAEAAEETAAEADSATEETDTAEEATEEAEEETQSDGDVSFTDFIDNIPQLHRGATVKGVIVRYDDDFVYVDVRDKTEGRIPRREFDMDEEFDLDEAIATKKKIDVYVRNIRTTEMGKEISLSKAKVDFVKYRNMVEDAYNNKEPITIKVVNVVRDGVIASYGGVDIYIHRTQLEMGTVDDLEPYRGMTFDILVTQFDPDRRRLRVSGSRRALLNQERKEKAKEVWASIEVGDIYDGIVRNLTDFGAFVDIGGVDGLVHISELSWKRIKHPSEIVKVGETIQVYVKDFDKDRKRISLGYKRIEDDPYNNIEERFPVDTIIEGKVVRMFPFGAFVEIADGVDALCHISQISNRRLAKPDEVLEEGMIVQARVLEVSNETRRISISIKDVSPIDELINPPEEEAAEDELPTSYVDEEMPTPIEAVAEQVVETDEAEATEATEDTEVATEEPATEE
ncbi:MAG TPA: bifunctional 4-hydroxy-3-methylbut-2-enyl diphosphate reductase/30S ribosomal protein S1 [Clostridiaceae bacterium]|nr:bifunctional 4-hydroxy-3-methylbut-2-enyl diphosphate reductase/30S ribosomal protein S1 [Clostridiaceae bacterium]